MWHVYLYFTPISLTNKRTKKKEIKKEKKKEERKEEKIKIKTWTLEASFQFDVEWIETKWRQSLFQLLKERKKERERERGEG